MTEPPDPPPTIATMRTIGMVWAVVGGLAILVGVFATVLAIVIFGVLALALGAGLVGVQHVRARSAIRASRTLTNTPPPPAAPPSANPPAPPPGPPTAADLSGLAGAPRGGEAEADVGSPQESESGEAGGSEESGDADEAEVVDAEPEDATSAAERQRSSQSISDEEDGTGSRADEDEPRRDA